VGLNCSPPPLRVFKSSKARIWRNGGQPLRVSSGYLKAEKESEYSKSHVSGP